METDLILGATTFGSRTTCKFGLVGGLVAGWVAGWVGHADISRTAGPIWLKFCRKVVMVNETKTIFLFFLKFFFHGVIGKKRF